MKPHFTLALALFAASAAGASVVSAQSPVQLQSKVLIEKTVMVGNREQTQVSNPDVVVPGDRLIFETAFRNSGARPVDNFVVTNPLPSGVAYAGQSSTGAELSVDGGRSWGQLPALKLRAADGSLRPARAADVTHLRWKLARIAPGAAGALRYRGVVR